MRLLRRILVVINLKSVLITILALASTYLCRRFGLIADFPLTLVATAVATRLLPADSLLVLLLALVLGSIAGALWGGLAALLRVTRGVSEVMTRRMTPPSTMPWPTWGQRRC